MSSINDGGWLDRMIAEGPKAEESIDPGDSFAPHDGKTSDLNLHAADLMADGDPTFDLSLRAINGSTP